MIDYKKLSRPLNADEIEFKVQMVAKWGDDVYAMISPYQDSRTPMVILDDVVGSQNWSDKYREEKDCVVCSIGIYTENGWVWKESNGTAGDIEPIKAAYSDALKRAAVMWGIGRGLYGFPKIKVKLLTEEYSIDSNGKAKASNRLRPNDWKWIVEYNPDGTPKSLKASQEEKGTNPRTLNRYFYTAK